MNDQGVSISPSDSPVLVRARELLVELFLLEYNGDDETPAAEAVREKFRDKVWPLLTPAERETARLYSASLHETYDRKAPDG